MAGIIHEDIFNVTDDGYRFVPAEEKYWPAIMDHLRMQYYPDEVLCKSLGSSEDVDEGLKLYAGRGLNDGKHLSVVALEANTNRIVGVRIARVLTRGETKTVNRFDLGPGTAKIIKLFEDLESGTDIFQQFEVDHVLELIVVSVDREYRRRGLSRELTWRNLELARRYNIPVAKGIFTSTYAQQMAASLSFEIQAEIVYSDYKDSDGQIIFNNTGLHKSVKLMVRKL